MAMNWPRWDEDLAILEQASEDIKVRWEHMDRAWDAYFGRLPKQLIEPDGRAARDNVNVNLCRVVADKGVSFLFGQDVHWEISETQDTEQEQWLAEVWRRNRQMTLLQKLALNGSICGHAFLKIVPAQPYPRLILLDPKTVYVAWQPDDIEQVTRYVIEYPTIDPQSGKRVVAQQVIERQGATAWRITDRQRAPNSMRWETTGTTMWPWPFAPVIDCQNLPSPNEFYGISDLEGDVIDLNNSINFTLSNLSKTIRYHASPQRWARGLGGSELEVGPDKIIRIPSSDGTMGVLQAAPFDAPSIEFYQRLKGALLEVARIPAVAMGDLESVGALSGVALQVMYAPLVEKTETKRRTYGDMLIELNRRLLAMQGYGDENYVTIHWPELLPSDPLQERQAAILDQQLGFSTDTIIERLGGNPELEAEKKQASSATLGDAMLSAFDKGQ